MEIISNLGLNMALIVAIVGICEFIKYSLKGKLKKLNIFLPIVLSICAGFFIADPFTFKEISYNAFVYFGVSVIAYTLIKKLILGENTNIIESIKKIINKKDFKK